MKLSGGWQGATEELDRLRKLASRDQVPFATMQTLNALAFQIRQGWHDEAGRVFDRPVPLTRRAALYTKATKDRLHAEIFIRDEATKGTPPERYLLAQVEGGERRQKRSERAILARGRIGAALKSGGYDFAVAGKGAQLDQFGNVRKGTITKILSQLALMPVEGQDQTETSKKRRRRKGGRGGEFFAITKKRGRLQPGIYERFGSDVGSSSAVRSILIFVRSVSYRKRYNVHALGKELFQRRYASEFNEQFRRALASAQGFDQKGLTL